MTAITNFGELRQAALQKISGKKPLRLGIISPRRKHLEMADQAMRMGLITAVLFGSEKIIRPVAQDADIDLSSCEIIDTQVPVPEAVAQAREKNLDIIFNGGVTVRDIARYVVKKEAQFVSEGKTLSHLALLTHPRYHKMIFLTDAAVAPQPDASQKVALIENAAAVARTCGIAQPKIALLAAVEAIYPAVPVTMEEAAIAKMGDRGQIKNVLIDGPLSFDCAISADVASQKGIKNSPVAGDPDILVTPTIETANGIYKAMVLYAGAQGAGVIYGGVAPVACGFEIDSEDNIINSLALAALLR